MATYKNISSDWYITVDSGQGTIYLDGNLDVTGNITYVSDIAVNDAFIIVAANNTGTINDMGVVAQKTSNTFAGLRFDTAANTWQISSSVLANGAPVSAYANIGVSGAANSTVAGSNTQIQFNQSGAFGASGNLTFDYANNKLTVTGYQVLGNIGVAPTTPSNAVALYNNTVGGGGTGVFVLSSAVNDELVSRSKAIVYSIIF